MKHSFFLLTTISFFLFSCGQPENPSKINTREIGNENEVLSEEKEFAGLYFPSGSATVAMFRLCDDSGSTSSYLVEDGTNSLDTLYRKILPTSYPYQSIFIKVIGNIKLKENKTKNPAIVVKKVMVVEQKNYRNNCIPYDYWCMGNEPFWQVQISEKENLIDFFDPMMPRFYHFAFSKAVIKGNTTKYIAEDKEAKSKIEITVSKEKCSDGMSEREYNYKSVVVLDGTAYNGCAVSFGDKTITN